MTLKKNTKDTSDWSLRSSVTAGTNRWTFRRGLMHFCSLIFFYPSTRSSPRSQESSNVSFSVFSRLRKWYGKTSHAHLWIRDDPDDWSDCSTLNGNVVYISWHIDYIDMISIPTLAKISIDCPIVSKHLRQTSEVTFDAILTELMRGRGWGGGGGTWVFFGWVCAVRDSK